jgi:hypothetical protein
LVVLVQNISSGEKSYSGRCGHSRHVRRVINRILPIPTEFLLVINRK